MTIELPYKIEDFIYNLFHTEETNAVIDIIELILEETETGGYSREAIRELLNDILTEIE